MTISSPAKLRHALCQLEEFTASSQSAELNGCLNRVNVLSLLILFKPEPRLWEFYQSLSWMYLINNIMRLWSTASEAWRAQTLVLTGLVNNKDKLSYLWGLRKDCSSGFLSYLLHLYPTFDDPLQRYWITFILSWTSFVSITPYYCLLFITQAGWARFLAPISLWQVEGSPTCYRFSPYFNPTKSSSTLRATLVWTHVTSVPELFVTNHIDVNIYHCIL